jgi:hypothetical protein
MWHLDTHNTHFLEGVSAAHFAVADTKEPVTVSSETAPHPTKGSVSFDGLHFFTNPDVCLLQVAVMFDSNEKKDTIGTTSFSKKLLLWNFVILLEQSLRRFQGTRCQSKM